MKEEFVVLDGVQFQCSHFDVVIAANNFNDTELLKSAMESFRENFLEILRPVKWQSFIAKIFDYIERNFPNSLISYVIPDF